MAAPLRAALAKHDPNACSGEEDKRRRDDDSDIGGGVRLDGGANVRSTPNASIKPLKRAFIDKRKTCLRQPTARRPPWTKSSELLLSANMPLKEARIALAMALLAAAVLRSQASILTEMEKPGRNVNN